MSAVSFQIKNRIPNVERHVARQRIIRTLRWLAMLPAAVAGGILAHYLGLIMVKIWIFFDFGQTDPTIGNLVLEAWDGGVFAAGFVLAGMITAPNQGRKTALVLMFFSLSILVTSLFKFPMEGLLAHQIANALGWIAGTLYFSLHLADR